MVTDKQRFYGFSKSEFKKACLSKAELFSFDYFSAIGRNSFTALHDLTVSLFDRGLMSKEALFDVMIDDSSGKYDDFLLKHFIVGSLTTYYWLNA